MCRVENAHKLYFFIFEHSCRLGGVAYIFDPNQKFEKRCNKEMVDLEPLDSEDMATVRGLLRNHFRFTGSKVALDILNHTWEEKIRQFIKVMPRDYKAVLAKRKAKALVEAV
jgi:glutamate synthase (NADPH) large chain